MHDFYYKNRVLYISLNAVYAFSSITLNSQVYQHLPYPLKPLILLDFSLPKDVMPWHINITKFSKFIFIIGYIFVTPT